MLSAIPSISGVSAVRCRNLGSSAATTSLTRRIDQILSKTTFLILSHSRAVQAEFLYRKFVCKETCSFWVKSPPFGAW